MHSRPNRVELLIRIPFIEGRTDIEDLVRRVEAPHVTVEILPDKAPKGCNQEKRLAGVRAMTRAWDLPYPEGTTHVLVLEDDAIVPVDAGEAMVQVVRAWNGVEGIGIHFFCAFHFAEVAFNKGYRYAAWEQFCGGIAQCVSVEMATDFNSWHRLICPPAMHLDARMNAYMQHLNSEDGENKKRVIYPTPSIVDHNGALPSNVGSRSAIFAPFAIGPYKRALDYDWSDTRLYENTFKERGKTETKPCWEGSWYGITR